MFSSSKQIVKHFHKLSKCSISAYRTGNIVGVGQILSTNDRNKNYSMIYNLIKNAKNNHPNMKMFFLPEHFDFMEDGTVDPYHIADSPINTTINDNNLLSKYLIIANEFDLWLSLGGFPIRSSDQNVKKVYNTHIIVNN